MCKYLISQLQTEIAEKCFPSPLFPSIFVVNKVSIIGTFMALKSLPPFFIAFDLIISLLEKLFCESFTEKEKIMYLK